MIAGTNRLTPVIDAVDHLLLGVSDLERGIDWLEQRTGIRAVGGGIHPGAGTRNALLSLGARRYMEIIAPDPAQPAYNFHIDVRFFTEPRLATFAAATSDADATAAAARDAGYDILGPHAGSRRTPGGELLQWRMLAVLNQLGSGGIEPLPFFIQWSADSPHPSQTAPGGCELESLRFLHPNDSGLIGALETFGISASVSPARVVRIIAILKTPKGRIELG